MAVTGLDWIIVAFAAVLASLGFRRGFIVGVLSFGGFAIGAFLGTRLGPLLLPRGSSSPYAPAFGLFGALLAGAILASGLEGIGLRLRRALVLPGLGVLDGLLGAVLGGVRGLGTACGRAIEGSGWVAGPDLVVTNAHVIAGEQDTTVEVGGRAPGLAAQPVAFDPTNDVAVLRASGLGLPALSLGASPP